MRGAGSRFRVLESRETANRIAAAVLPRRAERTRLQRRWMIVRRNIYRPPVPDRLSAAAAEPPLYVR